MIQHKLILYISVLFSCISMFGQNVNTKNKNSDIDSFHFSLAANIYLDSIVISAVKTGFDVDDFINIIRNDHSFNEAFHRLRFISYDFDHSIYFFNKRNSIIASYIGKHHQTYLNNCRSMQIIQKEVTGKYFKRNKYRYYTSSLFDKLFYTKDTICNASFSTEQYNHNTKNENKQINRLKTLIFNPGESVDVPLIGKKLAIFSDKMIGYYNMSIEFEKYQDSIPCFVFKIDLKEEFKPDKKATVIKHLYTYISKSNNQIVARDYQLAYDNFLYDFDVTMKIQLRKINYKYVPLYIKYDGNWDLVAKKREKAVFEVFFKY